MKNFNLFAIILAFTFIGVNSASAGPDNVTLNWGYQMQASETACPRGDLVLKVVRKIGGGLDSGTGRNDYGAIWWATSDYVQHIQVVQTAENRFCATMKSQGNFESVGGDGPGCAGNQNCGDGEGRLEAGVVGTFQGGMTLSFTGEFTPGNNRTKGSIGTLDPECYPSAGCTVSPVFTGWLSDYFIVESKSYDWWGWVYHAGNNGSWVNQANGNEGNITGD